MHFRIEHTGKMIVGVLRSKMKSMQTFPRLSNTECFPIHKTTYFNVSSGDEGNTCLGEVLAGGVERLKRRAAHSRSSDAIIE